MGKYEIIPCWNSIIDDDDLKTNLIKFEYKIQLRCKQWHESFSNGTTWSSQKSLPSNLEDRDIKRRQISRILTIELKAEIVSL